MGWTRQSVAFSVLQAMEAQQKAIAERVRVLRDARGWTNEKLAREADLSTKTVSRLVNGQRDARGGTLRAVAKALGVEESELRGPPVPPLGLGQDGAGQLDRIEALLTQLANDQQSHELAQKALGESLTVLASEVAALRDGAPVKRRRAS